MGKLQKYGKWNIKKTLDEKKEIEESMKSGPPIMKLGKGKTRLRFLPPGPGMEMPYIKVHQHFVRDGEKFVSFNCPKKTNDAGGKCPSCEIASRLYRSGRSADSERAKQYWPKLRFWSNVIDIGNPEDGVQALPFGKMIYDALTEIASDLGDFTDPEDGFNIIITRKGEGLKTRYTVQASRGDSPLEGDDWLEELHDLTAAFGQVPTFTDASDKMRQLESGASDDEDDDDDDDSSADDDLYGDDVEDADVVD